MQKDLVLDIVVLMVRIEYEYLWKAESLFAARLTSNHLLEKPMFIDLF